MDLFISHLKMKEYIKFHCSLRLKESEVTMHYLAVTRVQQTKILYFSAVGLSVVRSYRFEIL